MIYMAQTEEQLDDTYEEAPLDILRWPWYWRWPGGALIIVVLLYGSFHVAYAGKIFPGVSADGADLGGLTKAQAADKLAGQIKDFSIHTLSIKYNGTSMSVPVTGLDTQYDTKKAIDLAFSYGRQGDWLHQLHQQLRSLVGRPSNFAAYTYSDEQLISYLSQIDDEVTTPVRDATLTFNDNHAQVSPADAGKRLDRARLVMLIEDHIAQGNTDPIDAPVYQLTPVVDTAVLNRAASQADQYIAGPVTLVYSGDNTRSIDQSTIIGWLKTNHKTGGNFLETNDLNDLYPGATVANFSLDKTAVAAYVAGLAKQTDQAPQNATLAMQDNKLAVTGASHDGVILDQAGAVAGIIASLSKPADDRNVTLDIKTAKADVNESNLDSLGIKEQISEGQTFFPGSPSTRLTNVRAGASKFNGVLLKPNEVFSFGALLGQVDASTGYVPELVILGDHEEKQYGGGLCQVSSTAFRAALLAGLPITERLNHAFAISYYTAPFGVPGVDATIYYPQVDLKFRNDTGSYILIQTIMQGTTLKFDFFGTKTKSGTIRGPEFVTGDSDATKPSHTVFYRDILDMDGKVTKTDKFDTYYKSSLDYPVQTSGFN